MSPFGGYNNFEDCVSKNKDKKDPKAYCAVIMRKVEGKHDKDEQLKMGTKEEMEHTDKPKVAEKIAKDHLKEDPEYYTHLDEMKKKYGIKHSKLLMGRHWKKAKHSGLGQIPQDYTKRLEGQVQSYPCKKKMLGRFWKQNQVITHGKIPETKTAVHSLIGMDKFAELDVAFLREGDFKTNGVPYHYSWDVVKKSKDTFRGKPFYLNHNEESGLEMGQISDVYEGKLDGVPWLFAKVKIPEMDFSKNYLEKIQAGLVKDVSSTHNFKADSNRNVLSINGTALSSVKEGEVEGARILNIERGKRDKKLTRKKIGLEYKKKRGDSNARRK